jgi:CheY-like chemotaxis protein
MPYKNISCNILLVEDNKTDIDLIQRAMQKKDSTVQFYLAQDGEQALAHLTKWEQGHPTPLIVLLDLTLPRLDGLEVLRTLKAHARYRILPVIVLTSSNDAGSIQKAYSLGANSYIFKAVDYDEFASAILLIHRYWCELNIYPE